MSNHIYKHFLHIYIIRFYGNESEDNCNTSVIELTFWIIEYHLTWVLSGKWSSNRNHNLSIHNLPLSCWRKELNSIPDINILCLFCFHSQAWIVVVVLWLIYNIYFLKFILLDRRDNRTNSQASVYILTHAHAYAHTHKHTYARAHTHIHTSYAGINNSLNGLTFLNLYGWCIY